MKSIEVLLLSYNHADYIDRAIDSVEMQLSDQFDVFLTIIDDGSNDETVAKIISRIGSSKIKINLIQKNHVGVMSISSNLQELINQAKGDFLTFLSSDDEYLPRRFDEQLKYLEAGYSITYAPGINQFGDKTSKRATSLEELDIYSSQDSIKVKNYILNNVPNLYMQGTLIERNFIQSFQAMDTSMIADDWVFNIRVFCQLINTTAKFRFVNTPVFKRHIHETNTSRNATVHFERVHQVVNKYCNGDHKLMAKFSAFQTLSALKNFEFKSAWWLFRQGFVFDGFIAQLISKLIR